MSYDLSWLWDAITSIVLSMQTWFLGLWSVVQYIMNTGQGIFLGLIAFGVQLWDAITKGLGKLGEWFADAYKKIKEGLEGLADTLGQWLSNAFQWIGSAIGYVAQQIYNFGSWIWNTLSWIWDLIRNAIIGLWNWITETLSGIANAVSSWWTNVIYGVNTWFTNILKVFRQKIVTTIMADISIAGMWKAGERILNPNSLKDIGYGVLGILLSPFIGYTIGRIVDAIVPLPSTEPYPLIPDITGFTYTPPQLTIERPTGISAPSIGVPPTPPTAGIGLPYDYPIQITVRTSVDYTTIARTITLQPIDYAPDYYTAEYSFTPPSAQPSTSYEIQIS